MKIAIHAGHNKSNGIACGATGFLDESKEARKLVKKIIAYGKKKGHTFIDCTVSDGKSDATQVLRKIVEKSNSQKVDLCLSIHFNSGASDKKGNGKTTGTECLIYNNTGKKKTIAKKICKNMEKLGFKNRGVKIRKDLYVLRKTNAQAILVEVCFVDDKDDYKLYKKCIDDVAKAIVNGLVD